MRTPIHPSRVLPSCVVATGCLLAGCRPEVVPSDPEVVVGPAASLPTDPAAPEWARAGVHVAAMIPQDMVEPRLLSPSTAEVRVRALSDGARIAFRLEWVDPTVDETPGPGLFSDAVAVQIPAEVRPDVPAPQMGETGRPVEITMWRAVWQAQLEGRGDSLEDLYPNASIDAYPWRAASLEPGSDAQRQMELRYAPALALGNESGGPRQRAVEDLTATGPGTLAPGPALDSSGGGSRTPDGWAVVITRRLPAALAPGRRTQVAFAVWDGAREETGARKMRTVWIPMSLEANP